MYSLLLSERHTACARDMWIWNMNEQKRAFNVETAKKCLIRFVSGKFPYLIYIFTSVSSRLISISQYHAFNTCCTCTQRIAYHLYYFCSFYMLIRIRMCTTFSWLVGWLLLCCVNNTHTRWGRKREQRSTCRCTFWIYSFARQIHSGAMKYIRYHNSGTGPPTSSYTLLNYINTFLLEICMVTYTFNPFK